MTIAVTEIASETGLSEGEIVGAIERGELAGGDYATSFYEHRWQVPDSAAREFIQKHKPRNRTLFGGIFARFFDAEKLNRDALADDYAAHLHLVVSGKATEDTISEMISRFGVTVYQIEDDCAHMQGRIDSLARLDQLKTQEAEHRDLKAEEKAAAKAYEVALSELQQKHQQIYNDLEQRLRKTPSTRDEIRELESQLERTCRDRGYADEPLRAELREVNQRLALLSSELGTEDWSRRAKRTEAEIKELESSYDIERLEAGEFISNDEQLAIQRFNNAKSMLVQEKQRAKTQRKLKAEQKELQMKKTELETEIQDARENRIASPF